MKYVCSLLTSKRSQKLAFKYRAVGCGIFVRFRKMIAMIGICNSGGKWRHHQIQLCDTTVFTSRPAPPLVYLFLCHTSHHHHHLSNSWFLR